MTPAGLEPSISVLKGPCHKPLDEGAGKWGEMESNQPRPKPTDLQSAPLPLRDISPNL